MDLSDMVECCATSEDPLNDHFFNRPIDDIDIGRESLPILELSTSFGRESLGILRLGCDIDPSDYNFSLNNITEYSPNNVFNQAFLPPQRPSDFKSASTYSTVSSIFSFNVRELDQLSAIRNLDYTNSVQSKDGINTLNNAFLYSTQMDRFSLYPYRPRIQSLPVYTDKEHEFYKEKLMQQVNRVSEGCQKVNDNVLKNNSNNEESEYNDSVFLEAHYLSTKFSEGSSEDSILDETDPPALVSGDLEESECDHKSDKEEVFKKVDMLLPADGYHKLNAKLNSRSSDISKQAQSPVLPDEYKCEKAEEECLESNDVIDLPDLKGTSLEAIPSDVEKSKEILHTLSQILAKGDRSDKETQQGQNLLHTLSDMLNNKSRERSKSFTNSSVKSFYDTEEPHGNSTKLEDNSLQSNNSSKHNSSNRMLKRHSHSFSHPTKTVMATSSFDKTSNYNKSNNKSTMSNASEPSIEMKNLSGKNPAANLKVKKTISAPAKRGPMKATIAIDNLIKSKQKGTPPKIQQKLSKLNPKVSTPIRDVYIRPPMAQSTPDNKIVNFSSSSIDQPNAKSFSSSNNQEKSTITSGSGSSFSYKDSSISKDSSLQKFKFPRRNSISEDRKSSIPSLVRRSNSMKETNLMKTMNKIRLNISGSGALRDSSNIPAKDGGSKIYGKILNSSKKIIKSFGKENSSAVY